MARHANATKSFCGLYFKNDESLIESFKDKLRNRVKPIEIYNEATKTHDSVNHEIKSLSKIKSR